MNGSVRSNRGNFRRRTERGPTNQPGSAAKPKKAKRGSKQAPHNPQSPRNYCPHQPWPKQQTFLSLTCLEGFYGGAAGGGKSEALLMAALQYVHVPGYAALILRKDTQRLRLAGGLIPRSHEWLAGTGAKWNDTERCWKFHTSGAAASVRFGYLHNPTDKYRYASSEFQFIAFDELTEFAEEDYLFLFSRLRKTKQLNAPLRVRAASNPGGVGHVWVKNRFIPPNYVPPCRTTSLQVTTSIKADSIKADSIKADSIDASGKVHAAETIIWHLQRGYVPATIDDNPALNAEEYRHSLSHLPSLLRERLMNGDWSLREDGLLRADWLRYYSTHECHLELLAADSSWLANVDPKNCRRFVTVDPAGTSADRAREKRGRPPCATAIQVWDQALEKPFPALILREAWRGLVGFDQLCVKLRETYRRWHPDRIWIEDEKLGQAAVDVLHKELPIATVPTRGKDKVTRANWLISRLERGEIFLPAEPLPWRLEFEAELLGWSGHPDEVCDQVDAAAYAAIVAERGSIRTVRLLQTSVVLP